MPKGQVGFTLVKPARIAAVTANTSDLITTICDMGTCKNATAILNVNYTEALSQIVFWTSSSDSCITSATGQTATTNTVQVAIASDNDRLQAWNGNTQVTNLAVASNVLGPIAQDCGVAIDLPNIRRYLVMQYNGHGTTTELGVEFVGRDMGEAPYSAARTAYS